MDRRYNNEERKQRHRDANKRYVENHPEKVANYQHRWYRDHPDYRKEYRRKYRKTIKGNLHNRFYAMRKRCSNPKAINYERYGGRGIKCLFKSANEFTDYVINILKIDPRGLQIDRIDNNGHYEKGNIRFVTAKQNANNRRDNIAT